MAKTLARGKFFVSCSFKELWARSKIKRVKTKIKLYKHLLNNAELTDGEREHFKEEIRILKYEVQAWKSLLTNYYCPFADFDELWK